MILAALFVFVAFVQLGCMNGHDRPGGHGDVTFAISPRETRSCSTPSGRGDADLYLLDMATRRVTRIAATPDYEVDPAFSPDGKTVVYAAGRPGDRADHLFVRSLDGKTVKQLTAEDANDASPTFSPDGSLIAFTRDKTYNWGGLASNWDGGGALCVMKSDGSGLREITKEESFATAPQFSRDGKTIVFAGPDGMYTVALDGSEPPKPLVHLQGKAVVFSPDGQLLAYSAGQYAPQCRIFVARADGTGVRQLPHPGMGQPDLRDVPDDPGGGCFKPAFTPDGKRVLFFLEHWPDGASGDLEGKPLGSRGRARHPSRDRRLLPLRRPTPLEAGALSRRPRTP